MANISSDQGRNPNASPRGDTPLAWPWSQYRGEFPRSEQRPHAVPPVNTVSKGPSPSSIRKPALLLATAIIIVGGLTWRLTSAPDSSTKSVNTQPSHLLERSDDAPGGNASSSSISSSPVSSPARTVSSSSATGSDPQPKSSPAQAQAAAPAEVTHVAPTTPAAVPENTQKAMDKKHKKAKAKNESEHR